MLYFYDEEFLETGPTRPVTLLSLGIAADDGREFYRQSVDFDWLELQQNLWVMQHVVPSFSPCPAYAERIERMYHHPVTTTQLMADLKEHQVVLRGACGDPRCVWGNRKQIASALLTFMSPSAYGKPELWGYYSAYDHVVFCQIFGTMMDLPDGFPMYTRDLKQWCDALGNPQLPGTGKGEHNALVDARWNRMVYTFLADVERKSRATTAILAPSLATETVPMRRTQGTSAHRPPKRQPKKATA